MPQLKIDKELLQRVAKNARLKLSEEESREFLKEMQEILEAFSVLDKLDASSEKASFQPLPLKNVWRPDSTEKCLSNEEALSNTKHRKDSYFKGPRVV